MAREKERSYPYQDAQLSVEQRVDDLMDRMFLGTRPGFFSMTWWRRVTSMP